MTQSNTMSKPTSSLLQELRTKDYDRYALCLFAPAERREDLVALFLFNAELAHIRDQVTEPLLGQIRVQWWNDSINQVGTTNQPQHPLLNQMGKWQQRGISLTPLRQLCTTRLTDLTSIPFPDILAHTAYRSGTSHPLATISAILLQQTDQTLLYEQAFENYATIGLLRAIPQWLRRRQIPLPPEWIEHYNINLTALSEMQPHSEINKYVLDTARTLHKEASHLRAQLRQLPKTMRQTSRTLSLHNDLALLYAARLIRCQGNILGAPKHTARPACFLPYLLGQSFLG